MFGKNLQHYRLKHGLTKKALAAQCGLSAVAISNYENGKRKPESMDIIRTLRFPLTVPNRRRLTRCRPRTPNKGYPDPQFVFRKGCTFISEKGGGCILFFRYGIFVHAPRGRKRAKFRIFY